MATPEPHDPTAAELALGLLDGEERAAAMRRLLAEPEFARAVERWRGHFALWFDESPDVDAPAFRDPTVATAPPSSRGWRAVAVAAMAIAACLLVALLMPGKAPVAPTPAPTLVAALGGAEREPFAILYDPSGRTLKVPVRLSAEAGRALQLWAIGGDGVPHSLGLLNGAAPTTRVLTLDEAGLLRVGETLAISVEPAGGAPGDAPTGPVVATGKMVTT